MPAASAGNGIAVLIDCTNEALETALTEIAGDAWRRAADPGFPVAPLQALAAAGALGLGIDGGAATSQWAAVRAVAMADPVVGRIYERHLEAVEWLYRHAPEPLRCDELDGVGSGERLLGVWEGDVEVRDGAAHGELTYAIGAGGLDRVIVLGEQVLYVDVGRDTGVDRSWRLLQRSPMSWGERVELRGAPVLCTVWNDPAVRSRAELRRVAAHMGVVDAMAEAGLQSLAQSDRLEEAEALAAGRIAAARRTLDLWLADAAHRADADPEADLTALAAQTRAALAVIAGSVLEEADRAGVTPAVARARRELLLIPGIERPDSALASVGRELVRRRRSAT